MRFLSAILLAAIAAVSAQQVGTQHAYGKNIGSRLLIPHEQRLQARSSGAASTGGLYFVQDDNQMDEDGEHGQCARDLKFVGGKANVEGWVPSSNDANAGVGPYGACCAEMDVWDTF
ncbi:Exoglucanase 1 [Colletotrichum tanaceti]|uniref:cellulose 1,4-beta-cellobiosidase (non-reducing end) n=1 Tax=Colletotrichum tanaceti TaxID=1306861 RepID=A0A4V6DFI9_9PEZI|nr:Exoglucanase 1 [Colletotrichum tanaceti]